MTYDSDETILHFYNLVFVGFLDHTARATFLGCCFFGCGSLLAYFSTELESFTSKTEHCFGHVDGRG